MWTWHSNRIAEYNKGIRDCKAEILRRLRLLKDGPQGEDNWDSTLNLVIEKVEEV
jgi:hypothetical protein